MQGCLEFSHLLQDSLGLSKAQYEESEGLLQKTEQSLQDEKQNNVAVKDSLHAKDDEANLSSRKASLLYISTCCNHL